jgi:hypothetical protein
VKHNDVEDIARTKGRGEPCSVCHRPGAHWKDIDDVRALICMDCINDRFARAEAKKRAAKETP